MRSVEIFDMMDSVWRSGPSLPVGVTFSCLVEDRAGGVVLVRNAVKFAGKAG